MSPTWGNEAGWANPPGLDVKQRMENKMSKSIKSFLAIGLVALVAACGQDEPLEEYVVVDPEPISVEPVYTGKYK